MKLMLTLAAYSDNWTICGGHLAAAFSTPADGGASRPLRTGHAPAASRRDEELTLRLNFRDRAASMIDLPVGLWYP
jgi:hypothetical protein